MARLQNWSFTLAITAISRFLIFRDRYCGRLRPTPALSDSHVMMTAYTLNSGANTLEARFAAPVESPATAAVLICHGIGETVEHWDATQRLLAQNGVASLVFNYSGYGNSTGWITPANCEADALAAFESLRQLAGPVPISILGYSLGSGVAMAIASRVEPAKLVLCAAYTSLREAAASAGVPRLFTRLLPSIWTNVDSLKTCKIPVLVVHGEADRLFPPQMARDLESACSSNCEVFLVPDLGHNDPIYRPQLPYWSFVISRI
jgi:hypothetical protein